MYVEQSIEGASIIWHDAHIESEQRTHRGTYVEMVNHPNWGLTCYMDGDIQSSEYDEAIYHEALVHPAMAMAPKPRRVMIMGGGEGATAREVLKWPTVEHVDMYEWDMDVMALFRQSYPQWANGAWEDPRLHIHAVDVMEVIQTRPANEYDVIIVDLFEPSETCRAQWKLLIDHLHKWMRTETTIAFYAGDPRARPTDASTGGILAELLRPKLGDYQRVLPYRTFLPCFMGEAEFVLWCGKWQSISTSKLMTKSRWERLLEAAQSGATRSVGANRRGAPGRVADVL
jgi:spermidine synthase